MQESEYRSQNSSPIRGGEAFFDIVGAIGGAAGRKGCVKAVRDSDAAGDL